MAKLDMQEHCDVTESHWMSPPGMEYQQFNIRQIKNLLIFRSLANYLYKEISEQQNDFRVDLIDWRVKMCYRFNWI